MNQSEQPVQRHRAEAGVALRLAGLCGESRRQLALGFAEDLPRDVHRRRQPVREREIGQTARASDARREAAPHPS